MHHVVHRIEDVLHQVLFVSVSELSLLELLLSIDRAEVLFIVEAEIVGGFGFVNGPVLVNEELKEECGLLANVA